LRHGGEVAILLSSAEPRRSASIVGIACLVRAPTVPTAEHASRRILFPSYITPIAHFTRAQLTGVCVWESQGRQREIRTCRARTDRGQTEPDSPFTKQWHDRKSTPTSSRPWPTSVQQGRRGHRRQSVSRRRQWRSRSRDRRDHTKRRRLGRSSTTARASPRRTHRGDRHGIARVRAAGDTTLGSTERSTERRHGHRGQWCERRQCAGPDVPQ
jgi:hypothetical protein